MNDQQPPQAAQPFPVQGGQPYAYQPPKKSHTLRNVLLILTLVFVLFVGGCFALLGGVANEVDKAIEKEEANDAPTSIAEGEAFTHDNYQADEGWTVKRDGLGSVTIEGLRISNDSDEDRRTALFDFTFYKGTENLAEVTCSSNEMQAAESSTMDCLGTSGKFPKSYDEIKVADSF